MMRFKSPYGIVTLTEERKQHIIAFHPDVASCIRFFQETLVAPELAIASVYDPSVIICYKFLTRHKRYLAIVVKVGTHPFVLTAYLAKKPKRSIL